MVANRELSGQSMQSWQEIQRIVTHDLLTLGGCARRIVLYKVQNKAAVFSTYLLENESRFMLGIRINLFGLRGLLCIGSPLVIEVRVSRCSWGVQPFDVWIQVAEAASTRSND